MANETYLFLIYIQPGYSGNSTHTYVFKSRLSHGVSNDNTYKIVCVGYH